VTSASGTTAWSSLMGSGSCSRSLPPACSASCSRPSSAACRRSCCRSQAFATEDDPTVMKKPRILSGMRPTGALHLGNYMGALENWVKLQDSYECFFPVVDWHSLTTDYANPGDVRENVIEVATDWLAAGLDP